MTKRRTYVDACVLLAAFQGQHALPVRALEVLDDENREFIVSDFLKLETLPKPTFHGKKEEVEFMEAFFAGASAKARISAKLTSNAVKLASVHDIAPVDSLHLAAAISEKVEEFITTEKPTRPMFRVNRTNITRSIWNQYVLPRRRQRMAINLSRRG